MMKLFQRYIVLTIALVITCLYSLHQYFKSKNHPGDLISDGDKTANRELGKINVSKSEIVEKISVNRSEIDKHWKESAKGWCYTNGYAKIDPFAKGPPSLENGDPGPEGRCVKVHFSPVPLPRTSLASYQGSGNTWVRHLLHLLTGVHTGSIYNDDTVLRSKGFLGEGWTNGSVVAVKTHGAYGGNIRDVYDRGILLIRNPHEAFISEFNRRKGHGHTALADRDLFYSYKWENFTQRAVLDWHSVNKRWLLFPHFCLHIIQYENLVQNTLHELIKLAVFLGVDRASVTPDHVQCVLQHSTGEFKRPKKHVDLGVFTRAMNKSIRDAARDIKFVAWNKKSVELKHLGVDDDF